jgi:hypothetical protein
MEILRNSGLGTRSVVYSMRRYSTEHQLFKVSERSISLDFLPLSISNAFLNLIFNVFSLLQALRQVRWPFFAAEGFVTPQLS